MVFADLVAGVRAVQAIADACGMPLTLRVTECPHGEEDPIAMLRRLTIPADVHRVILWALGGERVAATRALRRVTACGLTEEKERAGDLPREELVDVTERYAEEAARALCPWPP